MLFSAAVSVKMNVLLFAPALGLIMLIQCGLVGMLTNVLLCIIMQVVTSHTAADTYALLPWAVQVVLAAPFLMASPQEYMAGAFNFGRTFKHKWSVNFK